MEWSTLSTQVVVVLGALSGLLLALRKAIITLRAGKLDQKAELEVVMALNAKMRDELRQDNEKLRTRVAILEAHVETLDKEIEQLRYHNEELQEHRDNLSAEIRMLKLALNKNGTALKMKDE